MELQQSDSKRQMAIEIKKPILMRFPQHFLKELDHRVEQYEVMMC